MVVREPRRWQTPRVNRVVAAGVVILGLLAPAAAVGHAVGEDYVFLSIQESHIEGHFEIHFGDLESKLGLELDPSPEAAAAEVNRTAARVRAYIEENFAVAPEGGEPFDFEFTHQDVTALPQGNFAQYHFRLDTGPLPDRLALHHSMFYEDDKLHRGLVLLEYNAKTDTTYPSEYTAMVFSPRNRDQTLDLTDVPALMGPREMIPQGVWHIWIGIDHVLFLLALMLSTVLVRVEGRWRPLERFPPALWNLLKIVTVFTIAHSATLLLAALDLVSVPPRLVESVIALSIVLVAANNIFGAVREGSLLIILGLGLFHGLGFASVMGHLPFRMVDLLGVVIGFNIGVELGQIAIVALVFPLLFWLRRASFYQPYILKGLSAVLIVISSWWFAQRAFGLG